MNKIEQRIIRFVSENELLKSGEKILIALSGGPDSVFLLHFFNNYKKIFRVKIAAAHINHRLRDKNSDRDEIFCKAICRELKIPLYTIKKDVKSLAKKNKHSIEVAARNIRYTFFNQVCKKYSYDKILTAHNADDNVETVLLNLIKGAGLKGISGIPIKRGNIIRPILCLSKKEILDDLEKNQLEYRLDESNLENDFERNFLRNEVVPLLTNRLNPSLSKSVLATSLNLQSLVSEIEIESDKIKSFLQKKSKNEIRIPYVILKENPIISYSIKQNLEEYFKIKLESTDIKKILALLNKEIGKSEELTGGLIAQKDRNEIIIQKNNQTKKIESRKIIVGQTVKINNHSVSINKVKPNEIKFDTSRKTEYISADDAANVFTLRTWKAGDKFYPIGMKGSKKVSDYLNDVKISSFEKKNQLVLENKGKIVWIIGQRLDERFKVTKHSKKVLKLCLK